MGGLDGIGQCWPLSLRVKCWRGSPRVKSQSRVTQPHPCQHRYLWPTCTGRNEAVARGTDMPMQHYTADLGAGTVVTDEEERLLYVGGTPLLVFDIDDRKLQASIELGGTMRTGLVLPVSRDCCIILLLQYRTANGNDLRRVRLPRGRNLDSYEQDSLIPATAIRLRTFQPLAAPSVETGPRVDALTPRGRARHRTARPLATGTVSTEYERTFASAHAQYYVVYRDGELTVVVLYEAPATSPQQLVLPAASVGLERVRAAALWCPSAAEGRCNTIDDPAALLVAGTSGTVWQVVVLPLPLDSTAAALQFVPLHDVAAPALPQCRSSPCHSVGGLVTGDSNTLYMALEQDSGVLMVTLALGPVHDVSALQVIPPSPAFDSSTLPGVV